MSVGSPKQYEVDIRLKCNLITANDLWHLEEIINDYLDNLAKVKDTSVTWDSVDWVIDLATETEPKQEVSKNE